MKELALIAGIVLLVLAALSFSLPRECQRCKGPLGNNPREATNAWGERLGYAYCRDCSDFLASRPPLPDQGL